MLMPEYAFMSCVGVSVRKENGDKCIKMLCYAVRLLLFTLVLSVHGTWTRLWIHTCGFRSDVVITIDVGPLLNQ